MTDAQLITLALSIVLSIWALIYSNSGVRDAEETLRAELTALRADLKSDNKDLRNELKSEITSLRTTLERMDDNIARLLADHDRRLTKLESSH